MFKDKGGEIKSQANDDLQKREGKEEGIRNNFSWWDKG